MRSNIKVLAFDLDGTLTQHKTHLDEEHRAKLTELSGKYRLLMVGAGTCERIFDQMDHFPIDIIGNYGMQFAEYDHSSVKLKYRYDESKSCDKDSIEKRITELRNRYGYANYVGDNVEYHPSGCITFPLLGTKAALREKLAFDPDRKKRRTIYASVRAAFPEYTVFVGGSSSFDFAPLPYNKYYALSKYCSLFNLTHSQVVYFGDDYGLGGNDEQLYCSDIPFECVDQYEDFCTHADKYIQ